MAVKFSTCTQVGYIKSYQTNEKPSPNGSWLWSRDPLKFLLPRKISLEWLKRPTSNFVHWFAM